VQPLEALLREATALTRGMPSIDVSDAARMLRICNACRYCEGYCAVFPAMTRRLEFGSADVHYLANLCHGCGACLHACQYAPPHEFGINIPRALAPKAQAFGLKVLAHDPYVGKDVLDKARVEGVVRVYPIGAVTRGLEGHELAEMAELAEAGCVAFSDDGRCVMNAEIYRRAMEYALPFGAPIISHAEDEHLARAGAMHEGLVSTELGLLGQPCVAEDVMVARDILLAELTGAHVHIAHISTAGAVRLVREGKARGVRVRGGYHFAPGRRRRCRPFVGWQDGARGHRNLPAPGHQSHARWQRNRARTAAAGRNDHRPRRHRDPAHRPHRRRACQG